MSFEPLIWAMSLRAEDGLTATTKTVLVALANRCRGMKGWSCSVSHRVLAHETLFTIRTITTAVQALQKRKFLTVLEKGDGRGIVSSYTLHGVIPGRDGRLRPAEGQGRRSAR